MTLINWVHLSDWHEGSELPRHDGERSEVRRELFEDIRNRKNIDSRLQNIDFIVMSGDVAHSAKEQEYRDAHLSLVKPLLTSCGLSKHSDARKRIFLCAGNHDLSLEKIGEVPDSYIAPLKVDNVNLQRRNVDTLLKSREKRDVVLLPFSNFAQFKKRIVAKDSLVSGHGAFYSSHSISVGGTAIGIVCLNTAWLSGRNRTDTGKMVDYGNLSIGRLQIAEAVESLAPANLYICVMHHPLSWLCEPDRRIAQELLFKKFHFILHGHEHVPRIDIVEGTMGETVIVPAGATFSDDSLEDVRYINAYNFISLDTEEGVGYAFFRRWNAEKHQWGPDNVIAPGGGMLEFNLPKWHGPLDAARVGALNAVKNRAKKALNKRFIEDLNIGIWTSVVSFGSVEFVEFKVRYTGQISAGEEETFGVSFAKDKRIEEIINKNQLKTELIQTEFFRLDGVECGDVEDTPEKKTFSVKMPREKCAVEYAYAVITGVNDAYYFNFGRAVKRISLQIHQDARLVYDYVAVGGCQIRQPLYEEFSAAYEEPVAQSRLVVVVFPAEQPSGV